MKRHYIYEVKDKVTGEFYIGVRSCDGDPMEDPYMGSMKTWKPNKENLVKRIIKEYSTRLLANEAELIVIRYFINKKKFPLNRNHAIGKVPCMQGVKLTEEHKLKISEALKNSEKFKAAMNSPEHKKAVSKANTGKTHSEETKQKMSKFQKNRKHNSLSEETKKKISEGNKGRIVSEEVKQNMSKAQRNSEKRKITMNSEEYKEKMRIAITGKTHSEETKQKMSESQLKCGRVYKPLSEEQKQKMRDTAAKNKLKNNTDGTI